MTMPVPQGTRDAPFIIDDEEEDDVTFVAGPSRLPEKPATDQMYSTKSDSKALPTMSAMPDSKYNSMGVRNYSPASGFPQRVPEVADVPLGPRRSQPQPETASSSSSDSPLMSTSFALKRKRSIEDAQSQAHRTPPFPPGWVAAVSDPSMDPFAHLSKAQRKKIRKRLRAEEEARTGVAAPKPTQHVLLPVPSLQLLDLPNGTTTPPRNGGPERATYNGPNWPKHIAKGFEAPIPGPGLVPLSYSLDGGLTPTFQQPSNALSSALNTQFTNTRTPSLPSKTVSGMAPNAFGTPDRVIGKWTSPGSGFGLFPVSQDQYVYHEPACTLVLENMPKRFRTLDFVLQWCRDTALADDPAPLHVDVMRKLGKALVEFTNEDQAFRAFSSPKLINGDGRAQISVYWFCPENPVSTSLPARPSQHIPFAPVLPLHAKQILPPAPSQPIQMPSIARPLQPSRVDSFTPYSPPIHYPPAIVPSSLSNGTSPPARTLDPEPRLQSNQTPRQNNLEEGQRQDDTEMEEGEIEEHWEPDRNIESHIDSLSSTPRCSTQRGDLAHVEPRSWTSQQASHSGCYGPSPAQKLPVNAKTHARELTPRMTQERENNDGLIISSVHTPPWPSEDVAMDLTEHVKGASDSPEGSPQLMYLPVEEPGSGPSLASDFSMIPESKVSAASPMMNDGAVDVTMNLEVSVLPTPPTCDTLRSSPPPSVPPSSTITKNTTINEHRRQVSGPDQHGIISTLVSEQSETAKGDASSADMQPEALPQSLSDRLSELRQRVLASKKRKMTKMEVPASSSDTSTSTHIATAHKSAESDDATVSSARTATSSTSSASSSSSAESLFSTASISTSSSASSSVVTLPKSASYFDNMATAFLEDIFGTSKSDTPPPSDTESVHPSSNRAPIDPKVLLQNKQTRLDEHLAKSKLLVAQWEAAREKPEKTKIWALIKEEKRAFEAEEAATNVQLKLIEAAKATSTRPKSAPKKPSIVRWPQTRPDQMVLSVSDSEDDDSASEGDE